MVKVKDFTQPDDIYTSIQRPWLGQNKKYLILRHRRIRPKSPAYMIFFQL